jgi:putative ABC transport system permease protein
MIRNYLKIAFRNMARYRLISFINLLGLTVGLSCCILITLYVANELSYDTHNKDAGNIYRITRSFHNKDGSESLHLSAIAPAFAPRLKTDFPELKHMTRILSNGQTTIRYEDKLFNERNAYFADDQFFDFFTTQVVSGNPATALAEPRSIMLSEEMAQKYFAGADPLNKLVRIDNQYFFKVTGVFKALPATSHLHPEILLSFSTLKDSTIYGERRLNSSWSNNAFHTYVKLPDPSTLQRIQSQFPSFIDRHMGKDVPPDVIISKFTKLYFQKLTDIHLHSQLDDEIEANGDIKRVYIFSCIALFILIIACINYMNLSTARSIVRSREIGIRKAIGAQRRELIFQFLSESVLIAFLSLCAAVILSLAALPPINEISGQQLSISGLADWRIIGGFLLMSFVAGIVSGIYPALFMSAFNTVKVLKGVFRVENRGMSFRKVLVVSQFAISIVLIVATIVVFRQLDFMKNTSLGYDKEHVITTSYNQGLISNFESFRNRLMENPAIANVGRSSRIPTGRLLDDLGVVSVPSGDTMKVVNDAAVKFVSIDHEFIPTFGIKLEAGRNYSRSFASDSSNYILNEAAARVIGWKTPEEAVGRQIRYGGVTGRVIGVVSDFHFESMHERILPLLFNYGGATGYGNISYRTHNVASAINTLEKVWKEFMPDTPLQYFFMNDNVAQLYQSEQQQGRLFTGFAMVAILIACLGLFGLSAFTISQRVKEIGVRKVLGASIAEIVSLLSQDFLKLVLIATLIGLPVAWLMMNSWLQDFAYRIDVPWWALLLSPIAALLIAFLTISSQAIKAAGTNPVKSLRIE